MRYILAYVNMPDETVNLDMTFVNMFTLQGYVLENYRSWTSMSVTVLPPSRHRWPSLRHTVDGQI